MSERVQILGANGKPLPPSTGSFFRTERGRCQGSHTPYDAADIHGGHMVDWNPVLSSPDGEVNPYRDRMVARERDLIRNDGWASAAVTRAIDNVVGANFRPIAARLSSAGRDQRQQGIRPSVGGRMEPSIRGLLPRLGG